MSAPDPDPPKRPLLFPDPVIEFHMEKIDRAAIRARLRMTPNERLQALVKQQAALQSEQAAVRMREEPGQAPNLNFLPNESPAQKFAGFPTYTPEPDPALRPMLVPDPVIEVYMKGVDRGLIREQLKKTSSERLQSLIAMAEFYEEGRKLRAQARAQDGVSGH